MISSELISYIKEERAKNSKDSAIKAGLATQGWNTDDMDEAFLYLKGKSAIWGSIIGNIIGAILVIPVVFGIVLFIFLSLSFFLGFKGDTSSPDPLGSIWIAILFAGLISLFIIGKLVAPKIKRRFDLLKM